MVNVASLMKNAKQEEQNKDTPSVTDAPEENKAIAPAPVEQNDIPSIPNVPADAKATTATSDGTVDIGTDKVKDASADVKATPVDYKYDASKRKLEMNSSGNSLYVATDTERQDALNAAADAAANSDFKTLKSIYDKYPRYRDDIESATHLHKSDFNGLMAPKIDKSYLPSAADSLRKQANVKQSYDDYKKGGVAVAIDALARQKDSRNLITLASNYAPAAQNDIEDKLGVPHGTIKNAISNDKLTAEAGQRLMNKAVQNYSSRSLEAVGETADGMAGLAKDAIKEMNAKDKAPAKPATPEIADAKAKIQKAMDINKEVGDKARALAAGTAPTDNTATAATDTAAPAAPVETPEEHHQKIVEYTKNLVDSNILQGQKPEDIKWTDKKVTDNITTNYNLLDDEHKAEAEKQLLKLATGNPEAEAAVKDAIINAKSSKWDKFWRDAGKWVVDKAHWLYDNRLSSNKQTFNEWINDNPSVLTAVFGNSGLNFGERLGNAVGLAAAMTSDIFKGVYEGANNMANSGPTSTKAFIEPYKSIAAKNIEQIVKNKEGTTEATAEQAKAAQKLKGLKVLKNFANDDVTNMSSIAANPNGDLSKIYDDDAMWKKAYVKAYPNVKEEDIDAKYAAGFLNWKQGAWNDITNSLAVTPERLSNTKALQDIDKNKLSIAQSIHNLDVSKIKDWNDAKLPLQNKLTELYELRRQAQSASDEAQLIKLAKEYKDLMTGMSSTSSTTGATKTGTSTKSSTNTVGGKGGVDVKMVSVGGEASHTGSSVNAETNANNNTLTVTADANTQAVLDFAKNGKLKEDFTKAKDEYLSSINSMIQQLQFALNQLDNKSKEEAADYSPTLINGGTSDARLKNLFDIGHYIPDANYYRARLSLV